ncbi:MAG: xanthine dehydrogenase family protein molybdopterin-binding subunit, partial [Flavobacteriaceae bacterium]
MNATADAAGRKPYVGRSVTRLEDPPLVRGQGRYVGSISFPNQLHMRIVRSPVAHGRLNRIGAEEARALPGVFAVWTAEDITELPTIGMRLTRVEGLDHYQQPVLSRDMVRYVGEPIAVVFAEDPYIAEDAADLVTADIDELPPLLDARAAPGEYAPGRPTEVAVVRKGFGDIDAAFAKADMVVALDLWVGRHSAVTMETRGAVGRYDSGRDVLEMYGAAKVPHWNRDELARMLGRDPSTVHLLEGHVGGGFGVRGELYPEDVLVCYSALRLRRPVKWIEDRRENLIAANHSRQQSHTIKAAIDRQGRILGLDAEIFYDQGGYVRTHGATVPDLAAAMLPGPYDIAAYRVAARVRLTNKTPCGTYRAPGRFEGTFVRERLLDAIAEKAGIDKVEVRRRNLIASAQMPYPRHVDTLGTDVVFDSGDYAGLLDKALKGVGWHARQAELAKRRAAGELVGLGLGMFVEKSGLGPFDGVRISVDSKGAVEVVTGAASVGQGVETVMAQICADSLGVDYRRIKVVHGRTDRIEFGMGAFASRVTVMTGEATRLAALNVRQKALDMAGQLMQAAPEELDITNGVVGRKSGGATMPLGDVARALGAASRLRGERTPGLSAEGWFYTDHMNYPYGVHVAQVRVDAETGGVTVEKYLVAYDLGRAVNPMLVEGQIVGGFVQGLGGALYE